MYRPTQLDRPIWSWWGGYVHSCYRKGIYFRDELISYFGRSAKARVNHQRIFTDVRDLWGQTEDFVVSKNDIELERKRSGDSRVRGDYKFTLIAGTLLMSWIKNLKKKKLNTKIVNSARDSTLCSELIKCIKEADSGLG